MFTNLRTYLKACAERGWLKEITEPCDPNLEIPEIHARTVAKGGPALLFKNPLGSDFPLVTNLFGTPERVALAFGDRPKQLVRELAETAEKFLPPKLSKLWNARHLGMQLLRTGLKQVAGAPIAELGPQVPAFNRLPATTSWPEDGGPFITLPLVYSEHPRSGKHNLGMYRMQIHSAQTTGMHWQIHKGGGFHFHEAERLGQNLPLCVSVGGPPALMLSAIAPLPEDVPELLLASLLLGRKLATCRVADSSLPLIAEAEFAFVGEVRAGERQPEGPFGDHYGYYSLQHDYPVFHCKSMYHRRDAIFCATVVGEPPQEDFFLGDYLQELLSPLFPLVMPSVRALTSYGETGFHSLAAASVKVRYPREALATGMRIFGEGQLSLTKILMLTDAEPDFRPFAPFLEHFLARTDFAQDLHVFSQTSMDTLDYTGPRVNEGSKCLWLAVGDAKYTLLDKSPASLPSGVKAARMFCRGCLVLQGRGYADDPDFGRHLAKEENLSRYRLLILVDDLEECLANEMKFLWTVFTRFEPAGDIHARSIELKRFHPHLEAPLLFDARLKPWYPGRLTMSPEIVRRVDERWSALGI